MKIYETIERVKIKILHPGRGKHTVLQIEKRSEDYRQRFPNQIEAIVQTCKEADQAFESFSRIDFLYHSDNRASKQALSHQNAELNRMIKGFYKALKVEEIAQKESSDKYLSTLLLLDRIFPDGYRAITRLPHEDKLQYVKNVLSYAQEEEGQKAIQTLDVQKWINRLNQVLPEFEQSLKDYHQQEDVQVTFKEWDKARQLAHHALRVVIAQIIVQFPQRNDEDEAIRKALLEPIEEQEKIISKLRRQHQKVHDIDPQTGQELSTP